MFLLAEWSPNKGTPLCLPVSLKGYSFRQGKGLAPNPPNTALYLNKTGWSLFPARKQSVLFSLQCNCTTAFFPPFCLCSHAAMLFKPSHLSCWPEELWHRPRLTTEPSCLATVLTCARTQSPSLQTQGHSWRLPTPALTEETSVQLSPGCVLPKCTPAAISSGSGTWSCVPTPPHKAQTTPRKMLGQRTCRLLF